jgi:sugar lactone lactonase YvrE
VTYDGAAWRQVNVPYTGWSGDMYDLEVDVFGDVWLATIQGVFHSANGGTTWTHLQTTNSDLPDDAVFDLESEPDGSGIWMATHGGLAFFDGATWTVYTTANSGLPADSTDRLGIAPDGALWVGAFDGVNWPYDGGLARFDGTTWRTWTEENSNIPHEEFWSLGFDSAGNVWVGTASEGIGLLFVDGDGGATTFVEIPIGWTATKGTWITGTLLMLELHDDEAVWIDTVPNGPKLTVASATVEFQTHVQAPSSITVHAEFLTDGVLAASLAVKNVVTGAWDPIGSQARFQFGSGTITADVPNPADHVASDGAVEVRVSARAPVSKNPFGAAIGIDQVELTVVE